MSKKTKADLERELATAREMIEHQGQELFRLTNTIGRLREEIADAPNQAELIQKLRQRVIRAKAENAGPLEDALRERTRERDEWKARALANENNPVVNAFRCEQHYLVEQVGEMRDDIDKFSRAMGRTAEPKRPGLIRRMLGGLLPAPKDGA